MSGSDPGPAGSAPEARQLEERLARKSVEVEDIDAAIERESRQLENRDRSVVTGTVLTVFFVALPLSMLALLVLSFLRTDATAKAVDAIVDILKSVLLPIMTLVLGYYFGRGGKG